LNESTGTKTTDGGQAKLAAFSSPEVGDDPLRREKTSAGQAPEVRRMSAATGGGAVTARRTEFDQLLGFGQPKSATLRGRNVASLAAATPILPTPWPLVPRGPTGLQNGGRTLLTVGPRRCAALRPVGIRSRSDDTPGSSPGDATV
jgi:hypothetical protein